MCTLKLKALFAVINILSYPENVNWRSKREKEIIVYFDLITITHTNIKINNLYFTWKI